MQKQEPDVVPADVFPKPVVEGAEAEEQSATFPKTGSFAVEEVALTKASKSSNVGDLE
jgi:hypothetical protein